MALRIPLPLTVSCFSKIQIGFTFLVPAHPGSPRQRAVKRVCVCVCVAVTSCSGQIPSAFLGSPLPINITVISPQCAKSQIKIQQAVYSTTLVGYESEKPASTWRKENKVCRWWPCNSMISIRCASMSWPTNVIPWLSSSPTMHGFTYMHKHDLHE